MDFIEISTDEAIAKIFDGNLDNLYFETYDGKIVSCQTNKVIFGNLRERRYFKRVIT
ncbi:hypothetical protein [Lentibacillus amyloliquefaciens]|uniref:hypothetical protein n=1 Tax=Lentibacillus amyloliquefaciens TaxID=1472767 RepID=UPI0012E35D36|nr:hypothetical protein [Lentibacillus amyloliquefaciens]